MGIIPGKEKQVADALAALGEMIKIPRGQEAHADLREMPLPGDNVTAAMFINKPHQKPGEGSAEG
jgi:hypothetical protein